MKKIVIAVTLSFTVSACAMPAMYGVAPGHPLASSSRCAQDTIQLEGVLTGHQILTLA